MSNPEPQTAAPAPMGRPGGRPLLPLYTVEVRDSVDAPLNMRRVTFGLEAGAKLAYKPGQAVILFLPLANGEIGRRDYTIRSATEDSITIDFYLHGDTPGPAFARNAKPGDKIDIRGPRGGAWADHSADWHLISGDETCIPAIQTILETAPKGAKYDVFVEIDGPQMTFEVQTEAEVEFHWVFRNGAPAGPSELMKTALSAFELPAGRGKAIVIGETSNVRAQRRILSDRGLPREALATEGYWRPGRIGGHDHVED